jgi:hypothetical protein
LPHGVLPTYGPEPRIAIAFNLQACHHQEQRARRCFRL